MVVVPARGRAQAEKASHLKLATHEMGKWWCQAEELLGWSRGETLQEVVEMRSSNVGHHIVSSNESFWVRTWKYIYIYYSSRKRRHGKLDITGHVWIHAGKMIDERFLAMSGLWLAGSICASCYISRFTKFLLDGLAKPRVTAVLAPGPILDIPSFSGNTDGTFPEILDHWSNFNPKVTNRLSGRLLVQSILDWMNYTVTGTPLPVEGWRPEVLDVGFSHSCCMSKKGWQRAMKKYLWNIYFQGTFAILWSISWL